MKIRFMQADDLTRVTEIHQERFSDSRSGTLGKPFLKKLYTWFMIHNPELSIVAEDANGTVQGFFVASKGPYTKKVFRFALPQIIRGILTDPKKLFQKKTFANAGNFVRRFIPSTQKTPAESYGIPAADELITISYASLAVASDHEGLGVPLLVAIEKEAVKNRSMRYLSSWVKKSNDSLIRIYKAFGWRIVWENEISVRLLKEIDPKKHA